ncbi:tryptophan synthase alpha chain-like [Aegilops tauschii subsp. strangulata]|uniref:tryptophan synthase alpha chain-like n=1 Tax=Aegilops tauschii subsp. strangulata TaxID=200361 RepID=UPI000989BB62|nr:tryptophan synthase alpha chain-like [Aegilops tauschii subsp. strangulata]
MAFALKASLFVSSSALPLNHPMRRGQAAVAVPTPGRPVVGAVAVAAVTAPAPAGRCASLSAAGERGLSVAEAMSRVRANGKTAFIPYINAGDPDLATTAEALRLLDSLGADVIELGLPFSDPSADGPVIQASAARALAAGATTDAVMSMLKEVTPELSCPVVIFSYFNPIVRRGTGCFAAAAEEAGVKGIIIPDLPYEEMHAFRKKAIKNNLELILLTTPATPSERMKEITKASEGFVYLVSVVGVTGARATINPRVKDLLQEIRQVTNKAVAVGFGISTPEHVRQIAEWGSDGVIIGSAMVKQLGEANSPREGLKRLDVYAKSLKNALP